MLRMKRTHSGALAEAHGVVMAPATEDLGVDDTSSNELARPMLSARSCVFGFVAELMKPEGRTPIGDGRPKFKGRKSPKAPNHHV